MQSLLRRYIAMVLEDARMARVPNQLVSDDLDSEESDVEESCGCGAVMGTVSTNRPDDDE